MVTGAARGIGEAVARRLAGMGATVLLLARDRRQLEQVRTSITESGGKAESVDLDLRDPEAISRFGEELRTRWRRCDVLVNNAGIGHIGLPLHQMDPADWDATLETNLRAPYLMLRTVAPLMIEAKSGHIINISSLAGRNPLPNGAAYSASKWGLNGLTYSAAEELRPYGIRVSVVAPGSVNTGFGGSSQPDADRAARKIQPMDIAEVVALLVSQAPRSFISEVLVRPTSKS